jgi:hypothetical protein
MDRFGTSYFTQSETSLVAFGSTIVVGFNDSGSNAGGSHFTGWSRSTDGGATWTDGGTLPIAGYWLTVSRHSLEIRSDESHTTFRTRILCMPATDWNPIVREYAESLQTSPPRLRIMRWGFKGQPRSDGNGQAYQ